LSFTNLLITQQQETVSSSVVYYILLTEHLQRQGRLLLPWGSYSTFPKKKLQSMDSQTTMAKSLELAAHQGKQIAVRTRKREEFKGSTGSR